MVTDPRLEKYYEPRAGTTQTLSIESVSLSKVVDVARVPFLVGLDWKQSVRLDKGLPLCS